MEPRPWHASYDEGVSPTVDYDERPLHVILAETAAARPNDPAVVFMNARLTWSEVKRDVDCLATALVGMGVEPGSAVAIQLPNLPQTVIAYYAALAVGARVVLTNPLYTLRELEHQWSDAECEVAIVTDFLWDQMVRPNRDKLFPTKWIVASIPEYLRPPLNWLAPFKLKRQDPPRYAKVVSEPGVYRFRELVRRTAPSPPNVDVAWDDVAVLQYTGGTTGASKGAMLTHANLSVNVQQMGVWFTGMAGDREVVLAALPMFHVFGMTVCMNWSARAGALMVLAPNPRDIQMLAKSIERHRVTIFPGVPAMFNAMNSLPGIDAMDVHCVKVCFSGSAPIADDVVRRFEKLTGATVIEGFGMSETAPVTHCNPLHGVRKLGSVGIPVPDTDAKIVDVDDDSKEMPQGQEGQLLVAGPQVMKGYWKQPEASACALKGGWMHTGDLAVIDADGYFRIVGRMKDMINCSGLKVFPDEVDEVLMSHEKILEAATIGVPDPSRGETVKSFIVLHPGETLTADEVEAYTRENLAAYKIPREVEFLDELPKSAVLKVLRRELRDRELAKRETR
ncbi:MAG: long-chain fatty acid--CoA ligase [bacterium]|nr:long-chain fatty acid--CoA ligase [bacterium]